MDNQDKPIKIKQRREVNIGLVIFLFVLIYLTINVYVPLTKKEITIYQVPQGKIYSKENFKGLIIRDERLYTTDSSGYINHYFKEGDKIAKNEGVYSIGSDSAIYTRLSTEKSGVKLSSDEISEIKYRISSSYQKASDFEDYLSVKEEIMNLYRRTMDRKVMTRLNEIVTATGLNTGFEIVNSDCSGIISYYVDDFTDIDSTNFNYQMFQNEYKSDYVYKTDRYEQGNIVYKLITSDDWAIIVELNNEIFEKLSKCNTVSFTVNGKQKLTAPVSFMKSGETYFAMLSLNRYVSNYLDERFVRISFDTEDNQGLKIPASALAYKDFYRIPANYFMTIDENTDREKSGLVLEMTKEGSDEKNYGFVETKIFWKDNGFNYVSSDILGSGEYIVKPDRTGSSQLYLFTVKLEGAYNVNNGYASFRRTERLETGTDYVLVKKGLAAGLDEYDRIALDAQNVKEGALIY